MAGIRAAGDDDLDAVRRCVDAAFAPYVDRIGRQPAPMLQNYAALIRAGEVRVLDGPDGITGVLVLQRRADHLFVDTIAVDPAHRGQGFGHALMSFAEEEARHGGRPEIRLYTHARMVENLPFYAALGFVETDRRVEDGYDRIYFRKRLW